MKVPRPPTCSQGSVPCPGGHDHACDSFNHAQGVGEFLVAQQAIGTPSEEAFGMAAAIYGCDSCKPSWRAFLGRGRDGNDILGVLRGVASVELAVANTWLSEVLLARLFLSPAVLPGGKRVSLGEQDWITSLPAGWKVEGGLYLNGCMSLEAIPPGLQVGGDLQLPWCKALRHMPEGLKVGGDLELEGCTALRELPEGLWVGGELRMNECSSLGSLPKDFTVKKNLYMPNCVAIERLPPGLHVRGHLDLYNSVSLEALPEGLKVGGRLELRSCKSLRTLSPGMVIGSTVMMKGCDAWDGVIPDDAVIGSSIYTDTHPRGVSLAAWRKQHPRGERA